MATIDIIIPANYTIEKTLFSIAYQVNVNKLNVYIVNDSYKKDYSEQIKYFSHFMKTNEIKLKKNVGLAEALQYGIDNSKSKYFMFMAAGDVLSSPTAIKTLETAIKNNKANIASSDIKIQMADGKIESSNNDIVSLYGKIYERKFFEQNKIRFCNENSNEDIGFTVLAYLHNAKTATALEHTYIKLYNYEIESKKNNLDYYYNNMFSYIRNMTYAINIANKQDCDKIQIGYFAFYTIVSAYYYYLDLEDDVRKTELLKAIKKIYNIQKKYAITDKQKEEIWYSQFMLQNSNKGISNKLNPNISLNAFMQLTEKT